MSLDSRVLENSVSYSEQVKCGIKYKKYYFNDANVGFKAEFPLFIDEEYDGLNAFILKLVEEHYKYYSKNNCKKIVISYASKTESILSLTIYCFYNGIRTIKAINVELATMLPITVNCFFKSLKIKKRLLRKTAKNLGKNGKIIYESAHIFNDKLKFFYLKKTTGEYLECKTSISKV